VELRFGELALHAFGLVDCDDDGLGLAAQSLRDARVVRRETVLVIDDQHDGVGFFDRELDLLCDE
jgi:hypothetical protein